ncbi:MAG: hypothetical protein CO170_03065 [candidate division SR1 bacterium CG_4_9_14_3_um_filter_40_9]|nr:MAG: hypothetical protein CO170_03065 [candidate division SR1 bacterium CG_4_9_14_3_um_filter_40_9]
MAKKKYVIAQKTPAVLAGKSESKSASVCRHFPGASKKEQHILQELAHVLEDLPEENIQESVLPHVRSYGIVRDTFLSSVHLHSHCIKINRELLSYEEKKQFNTTLALALEYLTDSNQQLFSKKEFQERFDFQEKGYKLYTAMIQILQRHDVQQVLNKQFEANSKTGTHILSAALEGVRLFLKKKASFVREEMQALANRCQEEIFLAFAI